MINLAQSGRTATPVLSAGTTVDVGHVPAYVTQWRAPAPRPGPSVGAGMFLDRQLRPRSRRRPLRPRPEGSGQEGKCHLLCDAKFCGQLYEGQADGSTREQGLRVEQREEA